MSYTSLLCPRKEVLSETGVDPIIDLANIKDERRRKLEARPADFFALTYPTNDIRRVVRALAERFSGRPDTPGLFLFEGLKGSGKSHLLLTIYHLFRSSSPAQAWLAQHGLTCPLPSDAIVVVNKFTDLPLYSIWDFVFFQLTGQSLPKGIVQPGHSDVERALGNRRLVLIFDELERGIQTISDPAVQQQNIAFLQMLSEWGNRSDQVTLFASVYSDTQEPGSTLKRGAALRVQFAQTNKRDRANVVLHRLFENHLEFDTRSAEPVADSYVNNWRRYDAVSADEYRTRLLETFPFTPDLLDVLLQRVPARGGFQNVRGALGFLANIVRLTHRSADLITPGHSSLRDHETRLRLSDLDTTGDLVSKAHDNLEDLIQLHVPLSEELAAAALLYTLASTGSSVGATREELIRAVVRPGLDINDFERTLAAFQKFAANFHESAGLYYFDLEETADAKVEFLSLREDYARRAPAELRKLWQGEVFGEQAAVVYEGDEAAVREAIEQLDKGRLRWVLAPRRLTPQERHGLYFGLSARNEVILLEPKDEKFDLDRNPDLLKWMRRHLAALDLASRTKDAKRRDDYQRIAREEKGYAATAIRRAGLIYSQWINYGSDPQADEVEGEPLGNAVTKEDVLNYLSQTVFPVPLFVEHIAGRIDSLRGRSVREVDQQYRNTLGFPVPTHADRVRRAMEQLCRESKLSLSHQRANFCGITPTLGDRELLDAIIDAPFSEPARPHPPTQAEPPPAQEPIGPTPGIETASPRTSFPPGPTFSESVQEIPTLPQLSIGALRQAMAEKLQAIPTPRVLQVQFSIVLEQSAGDLGTLPAALRGGLSGPGDFYAEINIKRRGDFSKAEIEQMAERLPVFSGAHYRADMRVMAADNDG